MSSMPKNNHHFGAGFTFGLVTGAAGFYLFGTKEGKKIRTRLEKEWQAAQKQLKKDGVLPKDGVSLGDFLGGIKDEVLSALDFELLPEDEAKDRSPKRNYHRQKTPQQFKGV